MRPRRYFVLLNHERAFAVVEGQAAARAASGGTRSYKSFKTELDAQEYASWWNYEAPLRAEARRAAFEKFAAERRAKLKPLGINVFW